jgi:4-hydroxyphenylacetate 3-monooxygenase
MLAAMATGDLDRMKGYGKTCMSEYDIDGWTGSDLINPDDVNVIRRGLVKQM